MEGLEAQLAALRTKLTHAESFTATETKIAEFAAFCVLQIDTHNPPVADYVANNEIQPIKDAHRRIFGCDPSDATIVRIVGRNLLKEVKPGMFVYPAFGVAPDWPQYLLKTIELCGVETKFVKGNDIPQWNLPPEMDVRVCMLS